MSEAARRPLTLSQAIAVLEYVRECSVGTRYAVQYYRDAPDGPDRHGNPVLLTESELIACASAVKERHEGEFGKIDMVRLMDGGQILLDMINAVTAAKDLDNRKLVWALMKTQAWAAAEGSPLEEALLNEITNRLYPEFDGESVTCEEWGWRTPEGEVRYL